MAFGEQTLRRGAAGDDVVELQMRLAGFLGTVPDGDFGPGTERQVMAFQRDVMTMAQPTGKADAETFSAIAAFAGKFPIDFQALRCRCGVCDGFGSGNSKDKFRAGKPEIEAFHLYEYPGIHRMLLWALRAVHFYLPNDKLVITSGYRCQENNRQNGRKSTNHHGKAVDIDIVGAPVDKREDMIRCDRVRGVIVKVSSAQIGWNASNLKSLEPANIAPTWVHYDVRSYARKYLADKYFCRDGAQLDGVPQ